jgi:hypothetical protein
MGSALAYILHAVWASGGALSHYCQLRRLRLEVSPDFPLFPMEVAYVEASLEYMGSAMTAGRAMTEFTKASKIPD